MRNDTHDPGASPSLAAGTDVVNLLKPRGPTWERVVKELKDEAGSGGGGANNNPGGSS